MDLADPGAARKPVQAIALEDPADPGIRDPDPVIGLQVPDDTDRSQVILATKVQDLLGDRWQRLVGVVMRHRALIGQSGLTM